MGRALSVVLAPVAVTGVAAIPLQGMRRWQAADGADCGGDESCHASAPSQNHPGASAVAATALRQHRRHAPRIAMVIFTGSEAYSISEQLYLSNLRIAIEIPPAFRLGGS